jgi:hypothetical protein
VSLILLPKPSGPNDANEPSTDLWVDFLAINAFDDRDDFASSVISLAVSWSSSERTIIKDFIFSLGGSQGDKSNDIEVKSSFHSSRIPFSFLITHLA